MSHVCRSGVVTVRAEIHVCLWFVSFARVMTYGRIHVSGCGNRLFENNHPGKTLCLGQSLEIFVMVCADIRASLRLVLDPYADSRDRWRVEPVPVAFLLFLALFARPVRRELLILAYCPGHRSDGRPGLDRGCRSRGGRTHPRAQIPEQVHKADPRRRSALAGRLGRLEGYGPDRVPGRPRRLGGRAPGRFPPLWGPGRRRGVAGLESVGMPGCERASAVRH